MTTRNLVPRADNEGKLGISSKKWSEVNATSANLSTLKVSSLKLNAVADLDFLTNGAGIESITTNNDGQFVIAIDDTFLTDRIGFNADGTKPDFTLPNGDVLPGNSVIAADDTLVEAIQKLNDDLRDVAAPSDLTVASFNADAITTSAEAFADNDTTLMTSAAIDDRILSYGYTTNTGDITRIISGTGLDLNGGDGLSGDVTVKLSDTTVTAGDYGSGTQIPTFSVDAQGRLTAAGTANISTSFNIADNAGVPAIDIFNVGETLTFAGGTGLETAVTNNRVTITLSDTAVTADAYGSATQIPTFTVDAQGRLTAAATVGITTTLTVDSDGAGTQDVSLADDDLQILGGTGLTSAIAKANNEVTVTLSLDDTAVAAAQYGDANSVGQFTVDAQGRLTQAANVDISIASSQVNDATSDNTASKIVLRDENGDFSAGTITADLTGNASSADTADQWDQGRTVTFAGGDVTGSFTIDGSADVNNVTLTIGADSVALGNDTTGDYVESLVAGAGIALANNSGESATPTVAVDGVLEDLDTLGAPTLDGQFIVATGAGTFAYETGNVARTSLSLGTGDSPAFAGLSVTGNVIVDNQQELRLKEANVNGANYISIKSPAALANTYDLVLPDTDGNADEVLVTDGDGNLSWTTVEAAAGNAVNSFANVAVAGQNTLEADAAQDTLTISAGDAISLTTDSDQDTLTIAVSGVSNAQIDAAAGIIDTKLATISTANKVSLTAIDIDGGVDIGAPLEDGDLIIIDDGAGGANRKSAVSRIATYINDHSSIDTLSSLSSVGSLGNTLTAAGSVEVDQNLTVTGTLTVNGEQFVVDGTTVQLDDNLIELGLVNNAAPTVQTSKDLGLTLHRHDGVEASKIAFYWDESSDKFRLEEGVTETNGVIDAGATVSTLVANFEGSLTGNADTATVLETTRAITLGGDLGGTANFNGSEDITIAATIQALSVETGMIANDAVDADKLAPSAVVNESVAANAAIDIAKLDFVGADQLGGATIAQDDDFVLYDLNTTTNKRVSFSNLEDTIFGNITAAAGDVTIAAGGEASIGALKVTNAMLEGNITNAKLVNDSVSLGGVSVDLGDSVAQPAFDLTNATGYLTTNLSGTITNAQLFGNISNDKLDAITAANKVDLSALDIDGAVASGALIASDLFIVDDGADGTNRKATLTQLVSFLQDNVALTSLSSLSTVGTIANGTWQGDVIADDYVANDLTISGGSVNDTIIGAGTAAAGTFTTLTANTSLVINGSTAITSVDTDLSDGVSANNDTIASAKAIKTYVDAQITAQDLDITDGTNNIDIDLDSETLSILGGTGIDSLAAGTSVTLSIDSTVATLNGEQTLTNKTLTSPIASGLSLSDSSIVFEGSLDDEHELTLTVENPTSDVTVTIPATTDTLVARDTTDTLTNKSIDADNNTISNIEVDNLKAGVLDTDLTTTSENDDTLASAKAVKAYVDGQIGRFGGIFLTEDMGGDVYDVVYDASPLVRSHFGPFAFDLGQLHSTGGSDILFYGATAVGASDRHFLVIGTGANKGDCLFTGADENTP